MGRRLPTGSPEAGRYWRLRSQAEHTGLGCEERSPAEHRKRDMNDELSHARSPGGYNAGQTSLHAMKGSSVESIS